MAEFAVYSGVVGCNNPRVTHDDVHVTLVKELTKTMYWYYKQLRAMQPLSWAYGA
jgi:hypothetical protein